MYSNYLDKIKNKKEIFKMKSFGKFLYFISEIKFFNIIFNFLINLFSKKEYKKIKKTYYIRKKILIYTAVFGSYDEIPEPIYSGKNVEYFIFTDQKINVNSKWRKIDYNKYILKGNYSNIELNRFFKMYGYKYLPSSTEFSLYIDGNIQIYADPSEMIKNVGELGISIHNHYRVRCSYNEIERCIKFKKDIAEKLHSHKIYLESIGFPKNLGMFELPIILRDKRNNKLSSIMDKWWINFLNHSRRDQISFMQTLWEKNINPKNINLLGNDIYSNYIFRKLEHNKIEEK